MGTNVVLQKQAVRTSLTQLFFIGIRIQKYEKVAFSWKTYQGKNVSSEEKGKVIHSLSELTKREFKAGFKQQKRHLQRIEWTHLQQIPEA